MTKPFTIGITGGSGSGKTFFLKRLAEQFRADQLCLLSQDHYYKPLGDQHLDDKGIHNFDLPTAIERERFHHDIVKLKRGEVLRIQEYTFNKPSVVPEILEFRPAPILILEGLFVQYYPEIVAELDLRIFIEAKDHLKLTRRILRDNDERGYDLDDVLYRYQHHVMPVYETLIKPLQHNADLVVPNNHHFERALAVITGYLKTIVGE